MPRMRITQHDGIREFFEFRSVHGAQREFADAPPYAVYGPLFRKYYGVVSRSREAGNVLKKGNLVGLATRRIASEIANRWNLRHG